VEGANQVKAGLGVYLYVLDPLGHTGDLSQDPPGGTAGGAER
jgi:hypothetical protein